MKMYKDRILHGVLWLFVGAFLIIAGLALYSASVMKDLKENIVRLHVVADSNDEEAQALKLKVRDSVAQYTAELLKDVESAEESYRILQMNMDKIQEIAQDRARAEGCSLPVTAQIGDFEFPVKSYGNITLPTGNYNAVRVTIGEGQGQNWWCVLFPPLCFVDAEATAVSASGRAQLQENLSEETYAVIENPPESEEIQIRFKVVDFFESIAQKARQTWTNLF